MMVKTKTVAFMLELGVGTYLAKDSYMTKEQFKKIYKNLDALRKITRRYDPGNNIKSDFSVRLDMKLK